MLRRLFALGCLAVAMPLAAAEPAPRLVAVHAARLLDVRSGRLQPDVTVVIRGDKIESVGRGVPIPDGAERVELGDATLLPGLIDCHTHLLSRQAEGDHAYVVMLATKSQAYRALEGAADARVTLYAGFTTVRDVESEGAGYADVALRDAIAATPSPPASTPSSTAASSIAPPCSS